MTCFAAKQSKFGVGGCCRLDLFSLKKNIFRKNFKTLRIICGGKCAVSKRELCVKVGKNDV